ncbi:MASE3 domain-containing sensor histidine kinase [Thermohalobacter berrensis]|uniref:histidine kinase n=1 Tax=Thermohalobacter berrensis TaxID=99594 RepID=A0A419T0Z8_9FIRM|nr:PocR ligand-binding domain-containing protein [Thermohalobacter berrensis]RKD31250.1 hypothetical protein BET03_03740 [Thermohalobacter berrensis]
MKYRLENLIDIEKFRKLMEEFYNISNIPYGLIDLEGNVVCGAGWQDICTKFHRVNPKSAKRCEESDASIKNRTKKLDLNKKYGFYKCKNGLIEGFIPIIVREKHIGTLCFGQFFFEKPDVEHFKKQAEEMGYDKEAYLKALSKVPVLDKEQVEGYMRYFVRLAEMLSDIGLQQFKLKDSEKLLLQYNKALEDLVADKTEKLEELSEKLQNDESQRKTIEENLKETNKRYEKLMEVLPGGIVIHKEGEIIFANSSFAKLLGEEDSEKFKGKSVFSFIHPDHYGKAKNRISRSKKGEPLSLREYKFVKVNGKVIEVDAISTSFPYDGETAILSVIRDISYRKQVEKLKQKVEEKMKLLKEVQEYDKIRTEFFANLSHEIRTPLNLIYSTLQLLEYDLKRVSNDLEKTKFNKRLGIIKQNCNRLLRLTNNILDMTKIDSGYFKLKFQNCNIVKIIEDITLSVAEFGQNNNIEIIFDTDVEEKIIALDTNAIERIMLNLLSNAVKFTGTGGKVLVKITTTDDTVIISVKDTGIGIPKERINTIFDRFTQVDKSFVRSHEGSGIGLSIVKALVDMHDGEISVESEYGKGSEFIVKLPARQIENENGELENCKSDKDYKDYMEVIDVEFSDIYAS